MSAGARRKALRKGADLERRVAELFGVRRVRRSRFDSLPDLPPMRREDGSLVQVEVKARARGFSSLREWIAQARSYAPDATPVLALGGDGGEHLAVLPLAELRALLGTLHAELPRQLVLAEPDAEASDAT